MESLLHITMDLAALGMAGVALLIALTIALGNVRPLSHPLARMVFTTIFAIVGFWLMFRGIGHIVSG